MKRTLRRTALALAMVMLIGIIPVAMAETVAGSTAEKKTFYVKATRSDAFIVLNSSPGLANVRQHDQAGVYTGIGQENVHGFYIVSISGPGGEDTYVWAPSAVRSNDTTLQQTQFYLTEPGDYVVTVEPVDSLSFNYWGLNAIESWVYHAPWLVSVASGCSVTTRTEETPQKSGAVTVYCYLNGKVAQSYVMTINGDQYIYPHNISGYRCYTGAQYVVFDRAKGTCEPDMVHFYYSAVAPAAPQPTQEPAGPVAVIPYEWDTQFKPETSQSNPTCWRSLPNLYDGDVGTSFFYTIWSSEIGDSVPEVTAYFNGDTVSSIGFVNGKASMSSLYNERARANHVNVRITYQGGTKEVSFRLADQYSQDFQIVSLGDTYQGVTKIEVFIYGYYKGEGSTKYEMNISEMRFYP